MCGKLSCLDQFDKAWHWRWSLWSFFTWLYTAHNHAFQFLFLNKTLLLLWSYEFNSNLDLLLYLLLSNFLPLALLISHMCLPVHCLTYVLHDDLKSGCVDSKVFRFSFSTLKMKTCPIYLRGNTLLYVFVCWYWEISSYFFSPP